VLLRHGQLFGDSKRFWQPIAGLIVVGAILATALSIWWSVGGAVGVLVTLAVFTFLNVLARKGAQLNAWEKFRKSKAYNAVGMSQLHSEGFVYQYPLIFVALRWEVISSAARFSDGFMLVGEGRNYWLPIGDITSGRIDDVETILKAKIADYKEFRA
jgi:hypothetical protein